ncbi:hypothetical protein BACI71_40561 [Bacillus mycoides]|uniref:Uncharacterized protein n=1 Tax=Bacillus mycoides TaxID=1405 RepID=A0A654A992_BACMY|nr:hypothetical protein BACI71_40561 [Bacillus mycoides]
MLIVYFTCLWRDINGTIMDEIIYTNDYRDVIFIYGVLFTCSNAPALY